MRRSLTRSLAIRCSILAVLGLFAAVGEHFLRDGVELHYELDEIADQLAAATHSESGEPKLVPDNSLEARLAVLPELRLAVVDQSGHLLFVYGSDPKALLATVAGAVDGYFELQSADGSRFGYIASRTTSDGTHLRIFAERGPAELRDRLIWVKAEILGEYGPFMLITSAVSILVVLVTVRRALRPLKRLSAEAAKIVPGHGKTLPVEQVPAEVVPLVTATNGALERLQEALARERRFTADIAHTLRTPWLRCAPAWKRCPKERIAPRSCGRFRASSDWSNSSFIKRALKRGRSMRPSPSISPLSCAISSPTPHPWSCARARASC